MNNQESSTRIWLFDYLKYLQLDNLPIDYRRETDKRHNLVSFQEHEVFNYGKMPRFLKNTNGLWDELIKINVDQCEKNRSYFFIKKNSNH